jgi:hypothetical protein
MQTSHSKRSANRLNALKSTGPKTAQGRKISAQNSTRHGLSVPLPPHIIDPLQQELTLLIQLDGIATDTARDIAQKIIDYERNLAFLREIFEYEMTVFQGVEKSKDLGIQKWQDELDNMLADIHAKHLGGMPWELKNMQRLTTQLNKIISKTKKDELVKSRRYFKRSSNQLIKALRRL